MQNNHNDNGTAPVSATLEEHKQALLVILGEFDRVCKMLGVPYMLFAGSMLGAVRHQGFIPWDDDIDVIMLRKDYERFLSEADRFLNKEKFYLQGEFSGHWPMFFSKLRLNNTTCVEKYHPNDPKEHRGVYIDIFPADNAARTEFGRRIQFYSSKIVIAKSLGKRGYTTYDKRKKIFMGLCKLLPMRPFLRLVKNGNGESGLVHSFFASASKYSKNVYPREYIKETSNATFEGGIYPISKHYDALLKIIYGDYMTLPPIEERRVKQHAVLVDLNNSYEKYADFHQEINADELSRSIR